MAENEKLKWYQFKKVETVFGIPIKYFIPAALVVILAGRFDLVPSDLWITAFAEMMAVGGLMSLIGESTPILRNIGGKLILPLLGGMLLIKTGILSEGFSASADFFTKNGFQMYFVAAVVAGSILATDAKFLKACIVRYIPVLLISQIFALGFSFLSGLVTGRSVFDAVFMVAAPCMSGGTSGAISLLPSMYAQTLGMDKNALAAQLYATALVGTYLSLIFTIVLKVLAGKFPKLMGNGQGALLKKESPALQEAKKTMKVFSNTTSNPGDLTGGLFVACAFMVVGAIVSKFVPSIAYVAWTLVIIILLKIFNLVPEKICQQAQCWNYFSASYLVIILAACIGMGSSSGGNMKAALNPSNLIIMLMTFTGACIGAAIGAKLFGLFRYEASLTAAMCSCNIGASGDVQMMYVTDRMELLPYATISTRIGGAMMIVEISILLPLVAAALGMIG